ncbi:hypothetical protein [Streptomyces violaceusniger]|uniref:Uncharacterized protein n=1 Tax=Streptomyces violaceusniger (strain Tu 4113) TaxID=653045 RepID=G2PHK9_STRV4|nr:hypothetical protein [Streptomyces violaceusniger]AEM89012.1 hypothetical protein Strvi_0239 [Streptomyces violaceusniger Tu 4113]
MYLVMAVCDGPTGVDTPNTWECSAALQRTTPENAKLPEAAHALAEDARKAGWKTDNIKSKTVLLCPDCYREWLDMRHYRGPST